jgi:hypothetical protein
MARGEFCRSLWGRRSGNPCARRQTGRVLCADWRRADFIRNYPPAIRHGIHLGRHSQQFRPEPRVVGQHCQFTRMARALPRGCLLIDFLLGHVRHSEHNAATVPVVCRFRGTAGHHPVCYSVHRMVPRNARSGAKFAEMSFAYRAVSVRDWIATHVASQPTSGALSCGCAPFFCATRATSNACVRQHWQIPTAPLPCRKSRISSDWRHE